MNQRWYTIDQHKPQHANTPTPKPQKRTPRDGGCPMQRHNNVTTTLIDSHPHLTTTIPTTTPTYNPRPPPTTTATATTTTTTTTMTTMTTTTTTSQTNVVQHKRHHLGGLRLPQPFPPHHPSRVVRVVRVVRVGAVIFKSRRLTVTPGSLTGEAVWSVVHRSGF